MGCAKLLSRKFSLPHALFFHISTLFQVLNEVKEMEENIEELSKAVGKEGPLRLTHSQLELRSLRPNKELVRDPVQYGLVEQASKLSSSLQQLQNRLSDSENALKALVRSQLTLQEDIGVKTNSLHIENQCVSLRKQINTASK